MNTSLKALIPLHRLPSGNRQIGSLPGGAWFAPVAIVLFMTWPVRAQVSSSAGPAQLVDTSFTISSAWQKVRKQFPEAVPVTSPATPQVTLVDNLQYATRGDRCLHLDLFLPSDTGGRPFPVVVLIHGGGWRSGNRTMEHPMAQRLATKGFAAAAVEYRLSGEAQFPAALEDVREAVHWLRQKASSYRLDPKRVAVMGGSAGGTLALLLGVTGGMSGLSGPVAGPNVPAAVQAVVDIDGVADMTDPAESGRDDDPSRPSAGRQWLGAAYAEDPGIWRVASPVTHAGPGTPPVLFVGGAEERFRAGRDSMASRLVRIAIPCEIHDLPGAPHTFWLFHPWFDTTVGIVVDFLTRYLLSADHPRDP